MQAYHFAPANYGLDDIQRRRLKIATIEDLNDPFELLCLDLSNSDLRAAILAWKTDIAKRFGMVCFSRTWRNPVQWSHYADKHRGLCLCFNVPDDSIHPVTYSGLRSREDARELLERGTTDEATIIKLLSTKYAHWHYEQEMRAFSELEERDAETQLFFAGFSDKLQLTEVIVGAESAISRADVEIALGSLASSVLIRKARLAFKSFRVTTQNNDRLWG
ncbi:hypothetical protein SCD_n00891 [Sulfuricella denitrificans skB26]|uniref:DUF2971 domain-containing protein n=1 Tax=Sulfuricella denitrificans (strain DSM 22764 / NBRC 105220 / skB26) TaxID=1163617 RepID=S6B263_SULDS|nr:DUF2971 domain-containing protein [Sulfuricella denitrificans]BAN34732.1 hypothetical protein SCD_n00891 [Sulfuricella denitrificans skB26]